MDGEKFAILKSATGNPLHRWAATEDGHIRFAGLSNSRDWLGLGRRVAIAGAFDGPGGIEHRLIVSDAEDPEHVLWTTPISSPAISMPTGTEGWVEDSPAQRYRCRDALLADIMPEEPGEEIAVMLNHESKSPSCIRVYSLDGRVLWEAWHNGRLAGIGWLGERRLLACGGVADAPKLADLGIPNAERSYPTVIFALSLPRSAAGAASPVLLDSWHESPTAVVAWCLTLPASISNLATDLGIYADGRDQLRVSIAGSADGRAGMMGSFELSGEGVVQSRSTGDWLKVVAPECVERFRLIAPNEIQ